ncbi:vWA domain-containing protein [Pinisolibacter sp.]|uniref:vWA domain-containing protein n=1 Tax=Pinisolibacter sp. TaxID=2172024 RepID=UPI002FDEA12D
MNRWILVSGLMTALLVSAVRPGWSNDPPRAPVAPATTSAATQALLAPASRIEVAFVLDTTGSMGGLIDGAKRKIWGIADEIRKANPKAEIRIGLVAYRDRGDVYVTEKTDLSSDIHAVYGKLLDYRAQGGGDWPESVNEALSVAVNGLDWTRTPDTRRIVFLVGDAPPHMDYSQDVPFSDTLKIAEREHIVVDAVQAGGAPDTETIWRTIASLGHGDYVKIPQTGGVVTIRTPYDQEILELQLRLNRTVVPYGDQKRQAMVRAKTEMAAKAAPTAASDMASYNVRAAAPEARTVVTGDGDLVADVTAKRTTLDKVKREDLPSELQTLSADKLGAAIAAKATERSKLQSDLARLVEKRDAVIAAKKAETSDGKDGFDRVVEEIVRKQVM